jgi:hypothetical protein
MGSTYGDKTGQIRLHQNLNAAPGPPSGKFLKAPTVKQAERRNESAIATPQLNCPIRNLPAYLRRIYWLS